jgi:hypothetical protein
MADLRPCDPIEALLAQTIVDHIWDAHRWKSIEASLLASPSPPKARTNVVPSRDNLPSVDSLIARYMRLESTASADETAEQRRTPERPTPKDSRAEKDRAARVTLVDGFQKHASSLELIARLRSRAEAQRDAALHDLEHYRVSPAFLRRPAIIDAQFEEVPPDDISPPARSQSAQRPKQHRTAHSRGKGPRQSKRAAPRSRRRG